MSFLFLSKVTAITPSMAQKGRLDLGVHAGIALTRLYEQANAKIDFYFQTATALGFSYYEIGSNLSRS